MTPVLAFTGSADGHGAEDGKKSRAASAQPVAAVQQPQLPINVPFVPGPFAWKQYADGPWFPWCLGYRSQGKVCDKDGIRLEVLDYKLEPEPTARVRLAVDGTAKELEVPVTSAESTLDKQHIVAGKHRQTAVVLRQDAVDLGFAIHLRRFRQRLDPGSGMASHYSSLVDFRDRSDPPRTLAENVLITLNAPVDFVDPRSRRTYRLFQSSFKGPWRPGDTEFDELAGNDRSRDRVYMSQFSVNYDPGRGLKYAGCVLIVAGITIVYYLRRFFAS